MKTTGKKAAHKPSRSSLFKGITGSLLALALMVFSAIPASAHCDSYDGPVVKDAITALKTNDVNLVLKWINEDQEPEITSLFKKTVNLQVGDEEVYAIVEKHFLETLVRLHRETEGEAFTGLKPAGSVSPIIKLADESLELHDQDKVISALTSDIERVVKERFDRAMELYKVRNESVKQGREFVKAYVQYTHTLEDMHSILEENNHGSHQKQ
ncbi:MAG: hypothetical protein EPN37_00420 [Chitinophagaceae bacterium]|nr:MAG: hypothetical protein EPN37_00420 [Chitinophagaceae bacterium]